MPPRVPADRRQLFRCINPFSVFRDGIPVVYGGQDEVLEGDPILATHPQYFEPAAERLLRRLPVEQATAAPGELRAPVLKQPFTKETTDA